MELQCLSAVVFEVFEGAIVLATSENSENLIGVGLDVAKLLSDSHPNVVLVSGLVSGSCLSLLGLPLDLALESVNHDNFDLELTKAFVAVSNLEFSIDSPPGRDVGQRNGSSSNKVLEICFIPCALTTPGDSSDRCIVVDNVNKQTLVLQVILARRSDLQIVRPRLSEFGVRA